MQGISVCEEWGAGVGTWRALGWGGEGEVGGGGGCSPHPPSPVRRSERDHQGRAPVLFSFAIFFHISKVRRQALSSLSTIGTDMETNALLLNDRITVLNSELILQKPGYNHPISGRRAREFS